MSRALCFVAVLAATVGPVGLAAQLSPDANVENWESRYQVALDNYRAAQSEWDLVERLWTQLENEYTAASTAGDEDREKRVLAGFQDLSERRDRAESALLIRKQELYEVGDDLISAIDARLQLLIEELQRQPVGSQAEAWGRYSLLDSRLQTVQREQDELGPRLLLKLPPMPNVQIREGDTSDEILYKARELEGHADRLQNVVDALDHDIETFTRRQRRERASEGVRARFDRFGDNSFPVTTGADATGVAGAGDTTTVNLGLTIEERIEILESTKKGVVERMNQLREKARDFREQAGGAS